MPSLSRCVLGHSLGALRHSVLGKLTGQDEADGRLDLPRRQRRALVVAGQLGSLRSDALKDVIHKGIQDTHGLVRDTHLRVDLTQHLPNACH